MIFIGDPMFLKPPPPRPIHSYHSLTFCGVPMDQAVSLMEILKEHGVTKPSTLEATLNAPNAKLQQAVQRFLNEVSKYDK